MKNRPNDAAAFAAALTDFILSDQAPAVRHEVHKWISLGQGAELRALVESNVRRCSECHLAFVSKTQWTCTFCLNDPQNKNT
jgi:hypothetical protein